jgi:hypothetical protein
MELAKFAPNKPVKVEHNPVIEKTMEGDFTIAITNVTGGDIQFLTDLIAIFCDPKYKAQLEGLRKGSVGIYRDPLTHKALVSDLFMPPVILQKQIQKN